MTKEEIEFNLAELTRQIEELQKKRDILRRLLAETQAEFKIGDYVTVNMTGAVWVVAKIEPNYKNNPVYYGYKLKKNGKPGARIHQISLWYGQILRLATEKEIGRR